MAKKTHQEKAEALLSLRPTRRGRPKLWKNHTANEKLVAIAYDVIQAVLAGVYKPAENLYVDPRPLMAAGKGKQLQAVLTQGELDSCGVCALGAGFLSLVRFENHKMCDDPIMLHDLESNDAKRMLALMGPVQFHEINIAYECRLTNGAMPWVAPRRFERLERAHVNLSREERMLAIWMNIIKHGGRFHV